MPNNKTSYLIIGCGHFGSRAAEKLLRKDHQSNIIAIDKDKEAIQNISHLPVETVVSDGLLYLEKFLSEGRKADYIIPAVPFHFAFEFILSQLNPLGAERRNVPDIAELPNPMKGKTGDLYTSFANFLCPEDCSEPLHCSVTGEHRSKPLFRMLMHLSGPFESKVIHSHQLVQGLGGFRLERLLNLTKALKQQKYKERLILISTACRCHAVTSALSLKINPCQSGSSPPGNSTEIGHNSRWLFRNNRNCLLFSEFSGSILPSSIRKYS